jgi:hypothetical protein
VYSFFVIYANIDGFDPAEEAAGSGEKGAGSRKAADGQGSRTEACSNTPIFQYSKIPSFRPIRDRSELDRAMGTDTVCERVCRCNTERVE